MARRVPRPAALALPPFDASALDEGPRPRATDLHRGLRRVDLGRPDARRQTPPARRPDQELIALGVPTWLGLSGGFPVTGGSRAFGRELRGGRPDPGAGAFTAVGVALATLFLTPLLFFLPKATLAAIIIVAVLSLVDLGALKRTWIYSQADFAAMAATILVTWAEGVEVGLVVGVGLSIFLHL